VKHVVALEKRREEQAEKGNEREHALASPFFIIFLDKYSLDFRF